MDTPRKMSSAQILHKIHLHRESWEFFGQLDCSRTNNSIESTVPTTSSYILTTVWLHPLFFSSFHNSRHISLAPFPCPPAAKQTVAQCCSHQKKQPRESLTSSEPLLPFVTSTSQPQQLIQAKNKSQSPSAESNSILNSTYCNSYGNDANKQGSSFLALTFKQFL